ncbi:hypothetical protein V4210_01595 [Candidatus Nanosynbacter sp. BB002]|uniref:hypothetical protein n=1 Tax=Candidatus Nanosynbacter sp. BB002 TaxID=3393757 RepID=UPI0030CB9BC9
MREGNRFSIETNVESLQKKVGVVLGTVASAALALSGCGAPITETAPTATTEGSTISSELDSTNQSNIDWQTVDQNCLDEPDCKRAISSVEKGCDGTTLLYKYYSYNGQGGITAVPNSPECTASQAPESSPTPVATATPTPAG